MTNKKDNMMKKLILFVIMAVSATMAMAQQNLRDGYVITLQGDTLHGVIDYRTSTMNTKRCVFKENGATEFKTYLPGEIDSYRFTNNGIFYVSRPITNADGTREIVFAEYVLHGNMNLYQIGNDEMLLEDEDGNLATFSLEKAREATTPRELRDELHGVLAILNKSGNATEILLNKTKNRDNTKKAVMAYVDDVCTDGFCEPFEYKSKSTPKEDRIFHPWVKAGLKYTNYKFWDKKTISGLSPQVSVGVDLHGNRLLKGLMATIGATFEPASAKNDLNKLFQGEPGVKLNGREALDVDFKQLDIIFGPGYQFQTGKMKTHVKVGAIYRPFSRNFNYTEAIYYYRGSEYDDNITIHDRKLKFDTRYGLFAGIGVEYPLKKCAIVCDLEYFYDSNSGPLDLDENNHRVTSNLNQHGVCLSVGVKF